MSDELLTKVDRIFNGPDRRYDVGSAKVIPHTAPKGVKFDGGKARPSLVPPIAMSHVIDVFEYGARKYSPDNWKLIEDVGTRYLDALMRHVESYRSGEYFAKDSGLPHLAHVVANALIIMEYLETIVKTAPETVELDKVLKPTKYEK